MTGRVLACRWTRCWQNAIGSFSTSEFTGNRMIETLYLFFLILLNSAATQSPSTQIFEPVRDIPIQTSTRTQQPINPATSNIYCWPFESEIVLLGKILGWKTVFSVSNLLAGINHSFPNQVIEICLHELFIYLPHVEKTVKRDDLELNLYRFEWKLFCNLDWVRALQRIC